MNHRISPVLTAISSDHYVSALLTDCAEGFYQPYLNDGQCQKCPESSGSKTGATECVCTGTMGWDEKSQRCEGNYRSVKVFSINRLVRTNVQLIARL